MAISSSADGQHTSVTAICGSFLVAKWKREKPTSKRRAGSSLKNSIFVSSQLIQLCSRLPILGPNSLFNSCPQSSLAIRGVSSTQSCGGYLWSICHHWSWRQAIANLSISFGPRSKQGCLRLRRDYTSSWLRSSSRTSCGIRNSMEHRMSSDFGMPRRRIESRFTLQVWWRGPSRAYPRKTEAQKELNSRACLSIS